MKNIISMLIIAFIACGCTTLSEEQERNAREFLKYCKDPVKATFKASIDDQVIILECDLMDRN